MDNPLGFVTEEPIDEAALQASVANPTVGAVVTFSGIVRNHDHGQSIRSLDYQAHPEASRILAECCARIAAESGLPLAAAHFSQKPLELMERQIAAVTQPGDVVWEPFGGLASASVAAVRMGRRAYVAELDTTFQRLAEKRLMAEVDALTSVQGCNVS